jgi:hypothetical protein
MRAPILFIFFLLANLPPGEVAATEPGDESWSSAYHLPGLDGSLASLTRFPEGVYACGTFGGLGDIDAAGIALLTDDGGTWSAQAFGTGLVSAWGKPVFFEGKLTVAGRTRDAAGDPVYGAFVFDGSNWSGLGLPTDHCADLAVLAGELYRVGYDLSAEYEAATLWRWSGSAWDPIAVTDGHPQRLLVHEGTLYVAGEFQVVDGDSVPNVFAWDGSSARALAGGFPLPVGGLVAWNGDLVVSGTEFRNNGIVASWDGTAWTTLLDVGRRVEGLCEWDGRLIAATDSLYDTSHETLHNPAVMVYDAGVWTSLVAMETEALAGLGDALLMENADYHGMVGALVAPGLVVHRAGVFEAPFPAGLGFRDTRLAIAAHGDELVVGGDIRFGGGLNMEMSGGYDGTAWTARDSFDLGLQSYQEPMGLLDLAGVGNDLFGIMRINNLDYSTYRLVKRDPDPPANGVWDLVYWQGYGSASRLLPLGTRLFTMLPDKVQEIDPVTGYLTDITPPNAGGDFLAFAAAGPDLVVAGGFTSLGGIPSSNVIRFDDPSWSDFAPALPGVVETLGALPDGGLAATYDTGTERRVATWDGAAWTYLAGDFDGPIHAMVWHQNRLVVAGHFTHIGPYEAAGIAVWAVDSWAGVGSGLGNWRSLYGKVDLASTSHGLYAAGAMRTAGGHRTGGLAAWTGDLRLIQSPAPVPDEVPHPRNPFGLKAYPNPFNPRTALSWDLPAAGSMTLAVYDVRGMRVRTLVVDNRPAGKGEASWDGTLEDGRAAPSGIYHLRLEWNGQTASRKLTLVR